MAEPTHPASVTFYVDHAYQCLGPDGDCSHVKNLTLRQVPDLEMSLLCVQELKSTELL